MVSQDPHKPQLLKKSVYLIVESHLFPVQKTLITIGRKIDNDVVIQNNFISRNHAQIRYEDGEFYIYDLKSTCGTFLNDTRVVRSILYSGDIIKVANTPVTFIFEGGPLESGMDDTTSNLKEKKKEIEQRTAARDRSLETKINYSQKEITDKRLHDLRPVEQKLTPPEPRIQFPEPEAADNKLFDQRPVGQELTPPEPKIQFPEPEVADNKLFDQRSVGQELTPPEPKIQFPEPEVADNQGFDQKPDEDFEDFLDRILGDSEPGNEDVIEPRPADLSSPHTQPQIQFPKPESRDTELIKPRTAPPQEPSIEKNIEDSKREVVSDESIDQKTERKGGRFLNRLFGFSKSESKKKEITDQEVAPKKEPPREPQIEFPKTESRPKEKIEIRPGRKLEPAPDTKVEFPDDERRSKPLPQKPQGDESLVYLIINQQIFHVNKDVITIGRELDNDVVLQDNFVSRNHAHIRFEGSKYVLYDQGSTSGSFINNKKVEQGTLYSGDLILIANIPMIFINERGDMESASEGITEKLSP